MNLGVDHPFYGRGVLGTRPAINSEYSGYAAHV
jgi:hypothetical protein